MDQVIRMGVIGPGSIFRRVMTDMKNAKNVRITAVASRNRERAQAAQALAQAEHAFTSYEELACCPDVDLVYIATPHTLHKEHALLCMRNGKHVICEKPMALNDAEVEEMIACARENGVFCMEAMWTRFMPAAVRVKELVDAGAIGQILHATANFSYRTKGLPPEHRLVNPSLAGGSLLDVGVYALSAVTQHLGYAPTLVQGACVKTDSGVDARFSMQLAFADGATAQLMSGIDVTGDSCQVLYGTKGRIVIPDFWHPTEFTVYYASGEVEHHRYRPENEGHHYEFVHAAECIEKGVLDSPVMPLAETLGIARIMTQLRAEQGIFYPQEGINGQA